MRLLLSSAIEFIYAAAETLYKGDAEHRYLWHHHLSLPESEYSLDRVREIILTLERKAISLINDKQYTILQCEALDSRFPVYSEILDIFPIYKDAVSLQYQRPVVKPSDIPGLLYLLKIPGYQEGLEVENHGFGYHFHYGRIKSGSLQRTNLLLTFDSAIKHPKKQNKIILSKPTLFSEYHADGKCKSIDVETIGQNKRFPIYLVCHDAGAKRGFENFKRPSKESIVFHTSSSVLAQNLQ